MEFDLDKMYCGKIKRGDIFLADVGAQKEQAIVVMQDDILNERLPTVVVVPVEPHHKGQHVFKNEVLLTDKETGFGVTGLCMLHRLLTLDRRQLIAKKGEVSKEKLQELFHALDVNLGKFRDRRT